MYSSYEPSELDVTDTRVSQRDARGHERLVTLTFGEPLACGMAECDGQAQSGMLEPDPRTRGLWRLLPLCPQCQRALASAAPLGDPARGGEGERYATA